MTIRSLTLLIALVLWTAVPAAAQQNLAYETFDLRFLVSGELLPILDSELPLWTAYQDREERPPLRDAGGRLNDDQIADLVRETIDSESWDLEGMSINVSWGHLIVRNKPDTVKKVGAFLDYLHAVVGRSIDVDVWRVPASAAPSAGVLSADQMSKLLERKDVVSAGTLRVGSSRAGSVRSGDRVSFLGDYDVEVAQDSQIADPTVVVVHDGLDLGIRASSAPDGRIILYAAGRDSSLAKLQTRDTDSTWVGRLQFPIIDSQVVLGSGVVQSGGGMIVGAAQGEGDHVFAVRARSNAIPAEAPQGGCALVPMGVSAMRHRQLGPLIFGTPTRSGLGLGEIDSGNRDEVRLIDVDNVVEMIRTMVDPQGWDEDPFRSLWTTGDMLFVKGPKKVIDGAKALATSISDAHLTNVGLEFRIGLLDAGQTRSVASGQADLAAVAGVLDTKAFVSTLAGVGFRQMLGSEQAYLKDHDVEIAQEANIADPVIGTLFGGVAFQGKVAKAGAGKVGLHGEFVVQDVVGEVVQMDGNANDIGVVDVPRTTLTRAQVAQILDDGRWTVLRLAPRPGKDGSLAILVRARL